MDSTVYCRWREDVERQKKIGSHTEPQTIEWLKSSFLPKFKSFYEECMVDGNIGKYFKLPSGNKTFEIADPMEQLKKYHLTF